MMQHLEELEKLDLPKDQFAIFGSGPLAIRKIRKAQDLDLIVKSELWEKLVEKHTLTERGCIEIGNIEIWNKWQPFTDVNILIDDADIIEGHRYVKLRHVLHWKKTLTREKDLHDIELLEAYKG